MKTSIINGSEVSRLSVAIQKYIVVKSKNGKERLIDTTKKDTKKKTKRVIGLRESKKRKMIYDFYAEAEAGIKLLISDINGVFKITKG